MTDQIPPYLLEWLKGWTPANWIAFGAALLSLIWNFVNSLISGHRERRKNRREEFDRRVARPIEASLDDLLNLHEKIEQLRAQKNADVQKQQFDELAAMRASVLRRLLRALRHASESKMCRGADWDKLCSVELDRMAECLDAAEGAKGGDAQNNLEAAAKCVDDVHKVVRGRIERELLRYA